MADADNCSEDEKKLFTTDILEQLNTHIRYRNHELAGPSAEMRKMDGWVVLQFLPQVRSLRLQRRTPTSRHSHCRSSRSGIFV
jgi:hypothetical protein